MTAAWRLHADGAPRLQPSADAAGPIPLSRKDAALLAHVAIAGSVPSARVAGWLWPGTDERKALNSLRQRLHRLRRATGARLLEVAETAALAADLSFVGPGDAAPGEAGELLGAYDYADAPDFAVWLEAERKLWAAARRDALADAASAAERLGELARALVCAQQLLAEDALSEHAHRRVMRLHYLRGDTAAAVAAFEACERTLKDELGLHPSAETLALLQTVEQGHPPAPAVALPMPASLLRPPRAVGRARERALLLQAHEEGHIAVLVGEAGMGKTRLLQDFVAIQPNAVYAQARPGDAAVPYGALARLLRAVASLRPAALAQAPRHELAKVMPELGEVVPGTGRPTPRLQPAIEHLLAAALAAGGHTLVVDDLHFADRASIEMLRALIDAEALVGLRWVFAHRPVAAADEDGALLQSLADAPRARWITLAPLTDADLAELLDTLRLPGVDAATLAPALSRHTGGNPLYVLETLRAAQAQPGLGGAASGWVLPQPHSIAHMIDRRLQRLSEGALALGRVAALAGPDFSTELAEHVLATPALRLAGAWAELEAADVLRGTAFAHDLVRDGMLRATPRPIAVHAHRLIAQFLDAGDAEPARVAAHWQASGAVAEAATAFVRAARSARHAGRPREQAQLMLQAARAFDEAGSAAQAIDIRSQALLPLMHGEGLEAAEALSEQIIEAAGDGPWGGLAWTRRASLMMNGGKAAQAEHAGRRALSMLAADQLALRIEASAALALACLARGQADAGLELMRPWLDRIDTIPDSALRIQFCSAHAVLLYHLDRLDDASRALARQSQLIGEAGESSEAVPVLLSRAGLELRRGDAAEAQRAAEAAAALQPDYDVPGMIPGYTRFLLGSAACAQGRYEAGLAWLEAALHMLGALSNGSKAQANAQSALAEVMLQIGQTARAAQLTAQDPAGLEDSVRIRRLLLRLQIARLAGPAPAALMDALADCAGRAGGYGQLRLCIEQAREATDPREAVRLCDVVAAKAPQNGDRVLTVLALTTQVDALLRGGQRERALNAAGLLEPLVEHCRSTLIYPPASWLACYRGYAANGRGGDARRCVDAAAVWLRKVALPNLPDAFRSAFLTRHPVNLALKKALRDAGQVSDISITTDA